MKLLDLSKKIKGYKKGWIALNRKHDVVEHAMTFQSLSDKIKHRDDVVVMMPASENYFGYVTANG